MNISQWILFSVLCVLLFDKDKASQFCAFILIIAYLFYQSFIVGIPFTQYYSYAAFLNLLVGIALQPKNKIAAICSYSLVLCNVLGFFLWYNYYTPVVYDNISLLILVLQTIAILPTRLLN